MGKKLFSFVALDGDGTEVYVQQNIGTVKEIRERKEKNVADVHFQVEKLIHPVHGWIPTDSEAYGEVLKAHETGAEVSFRIESQRKKNVNKETPIAELRKDMATAKENVITVLVEVNGKYTTEILTNPNEDPLFGDDNATPAGFGEPRTKGGNAPASTANMDAETVLDRLRTAITSNNVKQSIIEQIAALALFHGVTEEQVNAVLNENPKADDSTPAETPRAAFSYEAQPWKEYNTDGRLNLGNNIIAGSVGVENLVSRQLENVTTKEAMTATNLAEVSTYFGELIYAIADSIQQSSYGQGAKVDRSAMSHVRIRGIIYDVIERLGNLPVAYNTENNLIILNGDPTVIQTWIKLVGATSKERFHRAVNLSTTYRTFKEIVTPSSMTGGSVENPKANEVSIPASQTPTVTPEPTVTNTAPVTEPVITETPTGKTSIANLQALVNSVPADGTPIETKADRIEREAKTVQTLPEDTDEETIPDLSSPENDVPIEYTTTEEVYGPVMLEENDPRELASQTEVTAFQELFEDYGYDLKDPQTQTRIVKLLKYTFGENYGNARRIPAEELLSLVDFYIGYGPESLDQAIRKAVETN